MIQYRKTLAALEQLIEEHHTGWIGEARKRTAVFCEKKQYAESKSLWSKVKPVYMKLQGNSKCAYCERKLESANLGLGEQAVDHFRPKGRLRPWPGASEPTLKSLLFAAIPDNCTGYYALPYHPFNYAAACNPCNSILKRDYFPIAGKYDFDSRDPADLQSEQPDLIYPIGDIDEDPEKLIEFCGLSPRPVHRSGKKHRRALVTITFFGLASVELRKNLFLERAQLIIAIFPQLKSIDESASEIEKRCASGVVDMALRAEMAHANCCRSFIALYRRDVRQASRIYDLARKYVASTS